MQELVEKLMASEAYLGKSDEEKARMLAVAQAAFSDEAGAPITSGDVKDSVLAVAGDLYIHISNAEENASKL